VFLYSGWANIEKIRVTSASLFNLASISKVFDRALLAFLVRRGEVSLDDPVVNYIPDLQHPRDIRQVTLGQNRGGISL
jgi:CubicO group peptidase (beta-lactamase class C family)